MTIRATHPPSRFTTGKALRDKRTSRGLSQFKLAALAGVSLQTVSLAERAGFLTPQMAARLAAALGVRVEDVLGNVDSGLGDEA